MNCSSKHFADKQLILFFMFELFEAVTIISIQPTIAYILQVATKKAAHALVVFQATVKFCITYVLNALYAITSESVSKIVCKLCAQT